MKNKSEVLRELRELIGDNIRPEKEFWKTPDFPTGVAKGVLIELLGNAAIEWMIQLFIANPEPYIFWCEQEHRDNKVLPTALFQRGLRHNRIKFVLSSDNPYQPLRLALESRHYPFIVTPNYMTTVKEFQRLHLLAEKSKSTVFLLAEKRFSRAWPISLQLKIDHSPQGFQIKTHRQIHRQKREGSS